MARDYAASSKLGRAENGLLFGWQSLQLRVYLLINAHFIEDVVDEGKHAFPADCPIKCAHRRAMKRHYYVFTG